MANDPDSALVISSRRQEPWKPWFGDRAQFERLVELSDSLFEEQRARLVRMLDELPQGDLSVEAAWFQAKEAHLVLSADEGTRRIEGRVSEAFPLVDFPHAKEVRIEGKVFSSLAPALKSSLLVRCTPLSGIKIDVESNDEAWAAQAYSRLAEEAGRRRPWWASMKVPLFQAVMEGVTGLVIWALYVLAQIALEVKLATRPWWILTGIGIAALIVMHQVLKRMPVFEVHAEGGKPLRGVFLFWLTITVPTIFAFGILINLLT